MKTSSLLPASGDLGGIVDIGLEDSGVTEWTLFAVHEDGTVTEIGPGPDPRWDTSQWDNGVYRLEARDAQGNVIASRSVMVFNARVTPTEALGSIAVGTGVMVLGFVLSQALGAGQEAVMTVAEDKFRERTKKLRWSQRLKRVPTLTSLLIAVPLLAVFFAFDGLERLDFGAYLSRLPIVIAAAIPLFLVAYLLELVLNRSSGARSEFHLLPTGALAMAFSSLVFRTTFGYPGFVEETEGDRAITRRALGLRSLALLGALLFLFAPFLLLGRFWWFALGEQGMIIALTILATSSLPFQPVPGANIWAWNKAVSLLCTLSSFALLIAFQLALVPLLWLAVAGLVGALGYGVAVVMFRRGGTVAQPTA